MAEEENQRTIAPVDDDDDDDEEKESETETEGEESEPDASENPSKGDEAGARISPSASANPSTSIGNPSPVLSLDRNTNLNLEEQENGNGNGRVHVVEPVGSLSLSLGDNQGQRRAEREESMAAASRRLFQRLWTDEEEIRILQGFLDFTRRRGTTFASHQYDTGPFYEEIRQQLHLDFSKNQLIEKLRRLKKKYRNCAARMRSKGPAFSFRSPHEQAIYDIARHIWRPANKRQAQDIPDSSHVDLDLAVDLPSASAPSDEIDFSFSMSPLPSSSTAAHRDLNLDSDLAKPHSRSSGRRARRRLQQNLTPSFPLPLPPTVHAAIPVSMSLPTHPEPTSVVVTSTPPISKPIVTPAPSGSAIEATIHSCLSPLFRELVNSAVGGGTGSLDSFGLGPVPTCPPGKSSNPKWRQQHILELEVYLQRIELVREHVLQTLQDLRGSTT